MIDLGLGWIVVEMEDGVWAVYRKGTLYKTFAERRWAVEYAKLMVNETSEAYDY